MKQKKILAFEVTKLVHGEEEASKAKTAAEALFGGGADLSNVPTTEITKAQLNDGMNIIDVLTLTGLVPSKGEGRRLISQGGVLVNNMKIENIDHKITITDFESDGVLIKKGKKTYHRLALIID